MNPLTIDAKEDALKALKEILSYLKPIDKDLCIRCGYKTLYIKNTPVDSRLCYIEGAGQLCLICYTQIYGGKNDTILP